MTSFPNKELACSIITAHIAESLGFSNRKDIYEYYNGRGSFFLPKYINLFLEKLYSQNLLLQKELVKGKPNIKDQILKQGIF